MNTFECIYNEVGLIPKGYVASYGYIACRVGNPRLSRVVGYALHVNPRPGEIPCHRVVMKDGRLTSAFAFGGFQMCMFHYSKAGTGNTMRTRVFYYNKAWEAGANSNKVSYINL